MYSGQPLPYSFSTSSVGAGSVQPGYISPPDSRRTLEEDKEKQQPQRQSLPSIHEALGNDNPLPYPAPTSAPPQQNHPTAHQHLLSTGVMGRQSGEAPPGPPNPYSNGTPSGAFMRETAYTQPQLHAEASRTSLASVNTQDSRNPSIQSLSSGKSPTRSHKTSLTSVAGSQTGSGYEYSAPPSAGSMASPNGYGAFPQSYPFQSQQPPSAPIYPASYDARPYGSPWKPGMPEVARVDEMKGRFAGRNIAGQMPGDSVKRHIDAYDVESSLNEVCDFFPGDT
ncbi:hypothetical protein BDV25DRAFT_53528 [Aspergillus avenaceus]|uniref:Uncharacterized protein n=1 Tax=Aspergillus avenaceus TaxID=36643 RepID=A0A5N6TIS1_ASPAV|nr:hypothetical protein BDV25DRAFT_53528 [Aspergillus avenaceus]